MANIVFGENSIAKQLHQLKPNKATGPDEFPARVLKEVADNIAPLITHIFQHSYNSGQIHPLIGLRH